MQRKSGKGRRKERKEHPKVGKKAARSARVLVGRPWNEDLDVNVQGSRDGSQKTKDLVNVVLAVAFILLLCALAGYAMTVRDREMLREILRVTTYGLGFVAVWAGGKAALKVMSGWKNTE